MGNNLDKFDSLVVVMFENRSFDNLAGYLYENDKPKHFIPQSSSRKSFNGVAGKALSNPDGKGNNIPVAKAPWESQLDMTMPSPDPGEPYPHVNMQLYGNENVSVNISELPNPAPMNGFVKDYINAIKTTEGWENLKHPSFDEYKIIMNCFPPEATPVLSGLAKSFAISDEWFCSVPSQTFCNRSFFNSASSHGYVTNEDPITKWLKNTQPTIFNRLSEKGVDWRVYWDKKDVFGSVTRLLHPPLYDNKFNDHFRYFESFETDCANGDLPPYTFIEPRLFFDHNDMHPPVYANPNIDSSILAGEILLNNIYNAVRNGKNSDRTLLVVTFDEHGGTYDHCPPLTGAKPPISNPQYSRQYNFKFDRFGVRVPTIFISPYIEESAVVRSTTNVPFDHTSIIKTICEKWKLTGLTDRDKCAPDISPILSQDTKRAMPEFNAREYTPLPEPELRKSPLSLLQKAILGMLTSKISKMEPFKWKTVGETLEFMEKLLKHI